MNPSDIIKQYYPLGREYLSLVEMNTIVGRLRRDEFPQVVAYIGIINHSDLPPEVKESKIRTLLQILRSGNRPQVNNELKEVNRTIDQLAMENINEQSNNFSNVIGLSLINYYYY